MNIKVTAFKGNSRTDFILRIPGEMWPDNLKEKENLWIMIEGYEVINNKMVKEAPRSD